MPAGPPRERILAATTELVRRAGVRDLRVQAVAAAAGVSTPLVYHYFGNRAGLVRAALAAVATDDHAPDAPAGASARDRLVALLAAGVDDAPDRRDAAAVRNELAASALFDPELSVALAAHTARREAAVRDALRALPATASSAGTTPALARGLVGLSDGLVERWLGGLLTAERVRALVGHAVDAVAAP